MRRASGIGIERLQGALSSPVSQTTPPQMAVTVSTAVEGESVDPSYLHPYFPCRSGNFDAASRRILDFKDGFSDAFEYYLKATDQAMGSDITVSAIPPHAPGSEGPVRQLARRLGQHENRTDAAECLVRTEKIQKLSQGGCREVNVHLRSIRAEDTDKIRGEKVVLVDDVTTTGNSFRACKSLLLEAGARSVDCFALAKTTY